MRTRVLMDTASRAVLGLILASCLLAPAHAQNFGFSLAVDGEHVAGDEPKLTTERKTDAALAANDIQVRYTGMDIRPTLNVLPVSLRQSYQANEAVPLLITSNYPAFISRAEVIIRDGESVIATLPTNVNSAVSWMMVGRPRIAISRVSMMPTAGLTKQRHSPCAVRSAFRPNP